MCVTQKFHRRHGTRLWKILAKIPRTQFNSLRGIFCRPYFQNVSARVTLFCQLRERVQWKMIIQHARADDKCERLPTNYVNLKRALANNNNNTFFYVILLHTFCILFHKSALKSWKLFTFRRNKNRYNFNELNSRCFKCRKVHVMLMFLTQM